MIQEAPYNEVLKIRHEVMYPEKDLEYVKLPQDHMGLHMGYYSDGKLVSVVSLFLENRDLQFRKLATIESDQNKGFASEIIKWILDYAKDAKLNRVWCNARVSATSFYEKFGFIKTDNTFSKDGYDYVIMEKSDLQ